MCKNKLGKYTLRDAKDRFKRPVTVRYNFTSSQPCSKRLINISSTCPPTPNTKCTNRAPASPRVPTARTMVRAQLNQESLVHEATLRHIPASGTPDWRWTILIVRRLTRSALLISPSVSSSSSSVSSAASSAACNSRTGPGSTDRARSRNAYVRSRVCLVLCVSSLSAGTSAPGSLCRLVFGSRSVDVSRGPAAILTGSDVANWEGLSHFPPAHTRSKNVNTTYKR